ncbi:MAG: MgtE protein [Desulfobulbaceae bacterium]|nr:MAG: MgtE protein [Desulfobulbaceae bacterium]
MVRFLLIIVFFLAPIELAGAGVEAQNNPVRATQEELAHGARLRDQITELEVREQIIVRREQELSEFEQEVKQELKRLLALQEEIKLTLAELSVIEDQAYRELIRIYSTMRPSKVAELLNEMTDDDALKILRGLKSDLVANILPRLDQDKAVRLSRKLGLL